MRPRRLILAAALAAPLAAPSLARAGDPRIERAFKAKCAGCHGEDGKGATEQGKKMAIADMTSGDWQGKLTDEKIKNAILNGLNETRGGVKKEMESFKDKLRPEQVDGLVAYVRSLKK